MQLRSTVHMRLSRRQRGFTLVEILIASALLMVAMGLTVRFLAGFNSSSNRTVIQSQLEEGQRAALSRLEKELLAASEVLPVHPTDSNLTTTGNRLVCSVPLYNASGFVVVNTNGEPVEDTVVFEVVSDPDPTAKLNMRSTAVSPRQLLFSIYPSADSTRAAITNQVILKHLMPKDASGENYSFPQLNPSPVAVPTFQYLTVAGVPTTDFSQASQVRVVLWNEQEYGGQVITARKEFEFRLRNWEAPTSS